MRLSELLARERVRVPLEARTKDDLLRELVGLALEPHTDDLAAVLSLVEEREAALSTGIGDGVAIPHCRTPSVTELRLAAGRVREAIDFDALDGEPVRIFFMLVAPEADEGSHVKALSRIARLLRQSDIRQRLASAPDADTFMSVLRQGESA